jgi:hypothetical protein
MCLNVQILDFFNQSSSLISPQSRRLELPKQSLFAQAIDYIFIKFYTSSGLIPSERNLSASRSALA